MILALQSSTAVHLGVDINVVRHVGRAGSLPKRHNVVETVREFVMLPGLWSGGWQGWLELSVTGEACIGLLSFTILVLVVSLLLSFFFI